MSATETPQPAATAPTLRPSSGTDLVKRSEALDKAAIILMTMDQARVQQIFSRLDDDEIRRVSRAMTTLGRTDGELVTQTVNEFQSALGRAGSLVGSAHNTERMLRQVLPPQKAAEIIQDISGAHSGMVWEKLTQTTPEVLASYLGNESPQTAAVVLARLPAQYAAQVLALLPDATEVALRIVRTKTVQSTVLTDLEETLRREFVGDGNVPRDKDRSRTLADLLNHSDKAIVQHVMATMTERDAEAAVKVRRLMFGFEDLVRVDPATFGSLIAECPAEKLPIALATAEPSLRDLFLSRMSERAANMLREEMESMPPPRKRLVDEAQAEIVVLAKRLADAGRIIILDSDEAAETA
jgi:flagellar motor switch protein FliG